ncbi:MAG: type VI secretion system protein TssA [Acidobacteriota bacterium]|nr:type VI secretion system protein TssA [Acidobacteriota bacterium]
MPLREDLLKPIPGENPSGVDLRYDTKLLIYDKIKEARRQEDELAQGAWSHERKVAQFPQVVKLAQEALAEKSKDLQLVAWLTEGLLHTEGFAGLRQGLALCLGLCQNFWDTLYPPIEDGDAELRAAPLEWLGSALLISLKQVPLTNAGHDWLKHKESRTVGYENQVQGDKEKKEREKKIAEGKLAPEEFDKAFIETPKAFYAKAEKDLDASLATLVSLDELTTEKCGDVAPSFTKLKEAIEEVRLTVHTLLDKKRETEPDPVEEVPVEAAEGDAAGGEGARPASGVASITISVLTSSEPPDRREVIASVAKAAAFLRKREPQSPAPYLMMRGLRWGELRSAAQLSDPTLLEAPSTELRQQLKRLALARKWNELLETAENAMSLPSSRAWLDLQRLVVEACEALGSDYAAIAAAIRSELAALLHDVPELLHANLLDDTPAANGETRAWLEGLLQPVAVAVAAAPASAPTAQPDGADPAADPAAEPVSAAPAAASAPAATNAKAPRGWPAKAVDSRVLAEKALQAGHPEQAIEIMSREIARQRSGRGRFQRTLQLVEICVAAGKDSMAQPLLEDLIAAIEAHKLDDWEDKEMVAAALVTVMNVSAKVKGDAAARQKLFERICRLDPVRAASMG